MLLASPTSGLALPKGLIMKKVLLGCSLAAAALVVAGGTASADSGKHLGQLGQECSASYGFASLGAGFRVIVQDNGNNAGGVPAGLATYCPG